MKNWCGTSDEDIATMVNPRSQALSAKAVTLAHLERSQIYIRHVCL